MPNTLTITKHHEWDMAHRLGRGYTSKCRNLHGHRYAIDMTLECQQPDEWGMVLDFAEIKKELCGWIDAKLDHACMVDVNKDLTLRELLQKDGQKRVCVDFVTTVENICRWMFNELAAILNDYQSAHQITRGLKLVSIRVFETPNSWCDYNGTT